MLKFQQFNWPSTWYEVKLKTFIQCFEHAECIAIDIQQVTECTGMGSLDNVKK